jgi:hypothetical protein
MINILAQFFYLQALDLLTALVFMTAGVAEVNPLIRLLVSKAGSPLGGLVAAKLIALLIGAYCWRRGRQQLLVRVNVFYAALVAWNLVALLVSTAGNT